MPNYWPNVRVDHFRTGSPEVVIGHDMRISDPHDVRILIEKLHEVLDTHTRDNRWVIT